MRMCANCQAILKQPQPLDSQARKCSDCGHLAKAPWYCSLVCQQEHWSMIHWDHCKTGPLSRCPACLSPLQGSPIACTPSSCKAIYCSHSCTMKHWITLKHSEICKAPAGPERCYFCRHIKTGTDANFVRSCKCGNSTFTYCSWFCQAAHWTNWGHAAECPEARTTCWKCFRPIPTDVAIPCKCPVDNCEARYCCEKCLKDDFIAGHYIHCNGTQQMCCACGNELSESFKQCDYPKCDRGKWCNEVCEKKNRFKHIRLAKQRDVTLASNS